MLRRIYRKKYYTMSKLIGPLIGAGKLRMTIPEDPKSRHRRFMAVER
jgi:hypothetical protein